MIIIIAITTVITTITTLGVIIRTWFRVTIGWSTGPSREKFSLTKNYIKYHTTWSWQLTNLWPSSAWYPSSSSMCGGMYTGGCGYMGGAGYRGKGAYGLCMHGHGGHGIWGGPKYGGGGTVPLLLRSYFEGAFRPIMNAPKDGFQTGAPGYEGDGLGVVVAVDSWVEYAPWSARGEE